MKNTPENNSHGFVRVSKAASQVAHRVATVFARLQPETVLPSSGDGRMVLPASWSIAGGPEFDSLVERPFRITYYEKFTLALMPGVAWDAYLAEMRKRHPDATDSAFRLIYVDDARSLNIGSHRRWAIPARWEKYLQPGGTVTELVLRPEIFWIRVVRRTTDDEATARALAELG